MPSTERRVYEYGEVGAAAAMTDVLDFLNQQKGGTFFCLHGYESVSSAKRTEDGVPELADYFCQYGVDYGRIKDADIQQVREAIADPASFGTLTVRYSTWVDSAGQEYNRRAKNRTMVEKTLTLDASDSRVEAALRHVLHGLEHPKPHGNVYDKAAKGAYAHKDSGTLYLRDCLIVHKDVRRRANWKVSATTASVAVKKAVGRKLNLRTSRYRQFVFAFAEDAKARFEHLTIARQSVMVGDDSTAYFALPEDVKAALTAEEQAAVEELSEQAIAPTDTLDD